MGITEYKAHIEKLNKDELDKEYEILSRIRFETTSNSQEVSQKILLILDRQKEYNNKN